MKALVKIAGGKGNVQICEVPEPFPRQGQVKIEVKAAGICGSDIHILHGKSPQPTHPPFIMGHEFSGIIREMGPGSTVGQVGDRVVAETAVFVCEQCEYCRTGQYHLCREREGFGFWHDGAFAQYIIVPEKRVHKLPDSIDFISGALCEPLAVATHAVGELARILPGDLVLVSGVGTIGLLAAQVARLKGGRVILSGTSEDTGRLAIARSLGFSEGIDGQAQNFQACIHELSRGKGIDVVLECSGAPEAVRSGLLAIKKKGSFLQIGLFGKPFEVDFELIASKEITVQGSISHHWASWSMALKLLERGIVQTRPLVTDILPLDRWEEGFAKFERKEGMKILLTPVQS